MNFSDIKKHFLVLLNEAEEDCHKSERNRRNWESVQEHRKHLKFWQNGVGKTSYVGINYVKTRVKNVQRSHTDSSLNAGAKWRASNSPATGFDES